MWRPFLHRRQVGPLAALPARQHLSRAQRVLPVWVPTLGRRAAKVQEWERAARKPCHGKAMPAAIVLDGLTFPPAVKVCACDVQRITHGHSDNCSKCSSSHNAADEGQTQRCSWRLAQHQPRLLQPAPRLHSC